jgi:hypothetical protein
LCFSKSEQRQRRGEVAGFWEKLTEQLGQDQTRKIRHEQNRHSGVALSPCVKLFVHWFVILQRATLSFFGTSSVQLSERKSGAPLPKRHETKHLSLYSHSSRFKSSLPTNLSWNQSMTSTRSVISEPRSAVLRSPLQRVVRFWRAPDLVSQCHDRPGGINESSTVHFAEQSIGIRSLSSHLVCTLCR